MDNNQRLTISDQPCGFIGCSPRIIPGLFLLNSEPNSSLALSHKNTHLAIPVELLDLVPGTASSFMISMTINIKKST